MSYHVTGEQASRIDALMRGIEGLLEAKEKASRVRKELFRIRTPDEVNVRVKRKNAYTDLKWARKVGKEAMALQNAGRSIEPLVEKHKIPRSTIIGYMKRYYGFKPVSACGQKRKEFTPEQTAWAFAQRKEGKTLREIATALGVAISTLRHNIVLPDAPVRKGSNYNR